MNRAMTVFSLFAFTLTFSFTVAAQSPSREQLKKEIETKRQELVALENSPKQ